MFAARLLVETARHALALHFMYQNFCRIHPTCSKISREPSNRNYANKGTTAAQTETKMIKFLSSVEEWKSAFEWSSVGLLALTFIAGAGVVITSRMVNKKQAATILGLEKSASDAKSAQQEVEISLADAKTKQAEAEKSLLELQQLIREPRTIDRKRADEILKSGPKGTAEILFADGNEDAKNLAQIFGYVLTINGWTVLSVNSGVGIDAVWGITFEVNRETWDSSGGGLPETGKILEKCVSNTVSGNARMTARPNSGLPKDQIRIIVGPKY